MDIAEVRQQLDALAIKYQDKPCEIIRDDIAELALTYMYMEHKFNTFPNTERDSINYCLGITLDKVLANWDRTKASSSFARYLRLAVQRELYKALRKDLGKEVIVAELGDVFDKHQHTEAFVFEMLLQTLEGVNMSDDMRSVVDIYIDLYHNNIEPKPKLVSARAGLSLNQLRAINRELTVVINQLEL